MTTNKPLYSYTFTTRMHDIDAAGVVFYAQAFYYAHDAYEDFLNQQEFSITDILNSKFILPISHTHAEFKGSLLINQKMTIEIFIIDITQTYFILDYHFKDQSGKLKIKLTTQHVCVDNIKRKKIKIPDEFLKILTAY